MDEIVEAERVRIVEYVTEQWPSLSNSLGYGYIYHALMKDPGMNLLEACRQAWLQINDDIKSFKTFKPKQIDIEFESEWV